jgi:hypothetical protein
MDVRFGTEVEVETSSGSTRIFKIVDVDETNPKSGFISDVSPVGKALIGHKEGDEVTVSTPGGVIRYVIRSVKSLPGEKYNLQALTRADWVSHTDNSYYKNHCWNCKEHISSITDIKCPFCQGYKCSHCGVCFCESGNNWE